MTDEGPVVRSGPRPGVAQLTLSRPEMQRTWLVQRSIASLVQQIRRMPQPVIAAVNGPAAGGGLADAREAGAAYRQNRPPDYRNA